MESRGPFCLNFERVPFMQRLPGSRFMFTTKRESELESERLSLGSDAKYDGPLFLFFCLKYMSVVDEFAVELSPNGEPHSWQQRLHPQNSSPFERRHPSDLVLPGC
jgi:hypothetical protein